MANILIIEDDKEINQILQKQLAKYNYQYTACYDGIEGLEQIKKDIYDLILLDIMLPYQSGDSLLSQLRSFSSTPVIVISAKELIQTKIDMLRLGADDYITKPFDLDEVIARIEANLRRHQSNQIEHILTYKGISMNISNKQVSINNHLLSLTVTEFEILKLLLEYPQKVYSKANLFESVWKEPYVLEDNTLNTHMSRLRKKIEKYDTDTKYIETLWGMGYRMAK